MRRIKLIILMASLVIAVQLYGEPWEASFDANFNLNMSSYSRDWQGDETGALTWTINSNFSAQRQLTALINNKNTLKLAFGQANSQDKVSKEWSSPDKSTDLIDYETVFRFTFNDIVDPYASGRLESRFYNFDAELAFNPMHFTESAGLAKVLLKDESRELITRVGFGFRQHLDRGYINPETFDTETKTTNDGGIEMVTEFVTPLADGQIDYSTKITVFKALLYSEADQLEGLPNEDYWKSPDIEWENIFTASITKYLMVNLYIQALYDKEVEKKVRHKETLALGLTYKFATATDAKE